MTSFTAREIQERILRLATRRTEPAGDSPRRATENTMPHEPLDLDRLRAGVHMLREESRKIGQPPPRPPTLRASIGAVFVSFARRLMFWYTPPVQLSFDTVARLEEQQIDTLQDVGNDLRANVSELRDYASRIERRLDDNEREMDAVRRRVDEQAQELESMHQDAADLLRDMSHIKTDFEALTLAQQQRLRGIEEDWFAKLTKESKNLREDYVNTNVRVSSEFSKLRKELEQRQDIHLQQLNEQLPKFSGAGAELIRQHLSAFEQRQAAFRQELLSQSRRLSVFLEETRRTRRAETAARDQLAALEREEERVLDPLYVTFEDQFRGSRDEIKEKLREYLPVLARTAGKGPVLDIGCGRGEWLEMLREEGYEARGIDSNRLMVEECHRHAIAVEEADLLEHLTSLPEASQHIVTAFHVVEHLPFPVLVRFLDEVTRVLQPGGMAIFETPNPDNILVGSRNFYYDPTHHNPIPSDTLRFLTEARGLVQVEVLPLHPVEESNRVPEAPGDILAIKFNAAFYGPQDYAVIGRKA
jgi:2-polyprenyl-3-methyl-5-hydroxy-6-metoxy-1,4-benzoquinol methylase